VSGIHDYARMTLGVIRLVNGLAALLFPVWLLRLLGGDPKENRSLPYVFRMFGIRSVIIGIELLLPDSEVRKRHVQQAVFIHASDTTAAIIAGLRGQLPHAAAAKAVVISAVNIALAVLARPPQQ
jgi:hypothetical protein